jgi:F0F1-type ATP synthase membrane subunit a
MSVRRRGIIAFAILVVVGVIGCGMLPFVIMPGWGIGMALPIIEVPGEVVQKGGLFGIDLTNSFIGTIAADIMVLIFVFLAWRASKGWTKEVPNRFQALVESLVEGFYNFCKGIGGDRLRTAPLLWPLVATIFLFLLAGNMMKLFPGVETVGTMHCAHVGKSGYPITRGTWTDSSYILYVDRPLDAGTAQTEATEHACEEFFHGYAEVYKNGFAGQSAAEIEAEVETYEARVAELRGVPEADLTDEARHELEEKEAYINFAAARIASLEAAEALEPQIETLNAEIEAAQGGAADDHAAEEESHSEEPAVVSVEENTATEEAAATEEATATEEAAATEEAVVVVTEDDHSEGEEVHTEPLSETQLNALIRSRDALVDQQNLALSQVRYPGATLPLTQEQLDRGAIPFIFHVTPFVRGPATDLSLTLTLAILAMVVVQVYGVYAQGPAYFEKFINVSALGNLNKKPMGAIDFLVGLIEIISEIGKIVSLAFRLFGNLFAGGVALMAISFLVALFIPGVIYGLEIIIGAVQALVFAVLTLVFSVQAMEAHHGDDHDDHAHEGEHAH